MSLCSCAVRASSVQIHIIAAQEERKVLIMVLLPIMKDRVHLRHLPVTCFDNLSLEHILIIEDRAVMTGLFAGPELLKDGK